MAKFECRSREMQRVGIIILSCRAEAKRWLEVFIGTVIVLDAGLWVVIWTFQSGLNLHRGSFWDRISLLGLHLPLTQTTPPYILQCLKVQARSRVA